MDDKLRTFISILYQVLGHRNMMVGDFTWNQGNRPMTISEDSNTWNPMERNTDPEVNRVQLKVNKKDVNNMSEIGSILRNPHFSNFLIPGDSFYEFNFPMTIIYATLEKNEEDE